MKIVTAISISDLSLSGPRKAGTTSENFVAVVENDKDVGFPLEKNRTLSDGLERQGIQDILLKSITI